jgi:hypothetical protein
MTYPPPPPSGDQPPWPPPVPGYQPPGGPGPGYQPPWPGQQPPGPQPPGQQPGGTARYVLMGVAGGVVLVLIIVLIGVAVRHKPASTSASSSTTPSGAAVAPSAGTLAPAGTSSGPVGTTFTVTGFDHSQRTATYEVTLIAVSQSAAPASSFDAASPGHHLAYAEIKVTGLTGRAQDDANLDATATGSNQQVYQPSFDRVAAGTNFSAGDFDLNPGQTVIGYVSYELPSSVTVASVAWDANLQGNGVVTWTV